MSTTVSLQAITMATKVNSPQCKVWGGKPVGDPSYKLYPIHLSFSQPQMSYNQLCVWFEQSLDCTRLMFLSYFTNKTGPPVTQLWKYHSQHTKLVMPGSMAPPTRGRQAWYEGRPVTLMHSFETLTEIPASKLLASAQRVKEHICRAQPMNAQISEAGSLKHSQHEKCQELVIKKQLFFIYTIILCFT